jgi:hypothetical protein
METPDVAIQLQQERLALDRLNGQNDLTLRQRELLGVLGRCPTSAAGLPSKKARTVNNLRTFVPLNEIRTATHQSGGLPFHCNSIYRNSEAGR